MRKLLEKFLVIPNDELPKEPVDVIIGIGAGLSRVSDNPCGSISLSPQSEKVLSLVLELFEKGKGKRVFFSGGYNFQGYYESLIMCNKFVYDYLERRNKPIYPACETKSRNSFGNALQTLEWMEKNDCKSAIIVDFSGHLKQMKRIFLKQAKGEEITFYFVNAYSKYGGNTQRRLNNFYLFLVWEFLTNVYYKLIGAL